MHKNTPPKYSAFTLIELLVVIAIIGILSAIVLASLSGARERAKATAILGTLDNAMITAELHNANNGSYTGLCDSDDIEKILAGLESTGDGAACWVSTDTYSGSNFQIELAMRDYGIAASYNDNYYAVSPQGAVTFDEEDAASGNIHWDSAKTACNNDNKRLPTPSELRAIWGITNNTPEGFTATAYWSDLEPPWLSTHAYRTFLTSTGAVSYNIKSVGRYVRCVD